MKPGTHKDGGAPDALGMLKADHDKARALFRAFDALKGHRDEARRKADLVDEICYELTLHSMLEEELFYPALRAAQGDTQAADELLDEADIEHAGARELISQLEIMAPGDDHYDATVTVLGEEVEHHIDKEESELFEMARQAGIDLDDLGEQLAARKDELEEDLSAPPSRIDGMEPHDGARRQPRAPN
jgi:iron-sulfur cluster repair protein YtfE (RIC family)